MRDRAFVGAAEQGKNGVWRYILGTVVVLVFWLLLGSIPIFAAFAWVQFDGDPATGIDFETGQITGVDPLFGGYLVPNLTFPIFLAGIVLAVRLLHRRPVRSLITPRKRVDLSRVGRGFLVWGVLALAATGLEIMLYPGAFRWNPVPVGRYVGFALLALLFTPLQTTTEELFFRGYLLQGLGRVIRIPWLLAILNGVLFMVPHLGNPEVSAGPALLTLYYFGMGAFFSWITLRDGTAELALGAHAANNLFVALLINFEGSALQTPALVMSDRLDPLFNLVTFVMMAAVFYGVVFGLSSRRAPVPEESGTA